ncbi:Comitin [Tetrabaena socialis]|uniref:Comitin n=1 Tax=Tetrabaena socialis TaxID=47790 RepID=A0A2J7ZNA3_9CHLO|nr:Comitin [Tetrabaena socialis]|eukprot:PNH01745.1 Comitin [Tetrabaena socialis]
MQSAPPRSSSLRSDRSNNSLSPGESLVSQNARYKVTYETNGDLVLYPGAIWAAGAVPASGANPLTASMSSDGRLTLMDATGRPYWIIGVAGAGVPPYRLAVQNDRTLAIYDRRNVMTWTSKK